MRYSYVGDPDVQNELPTFWTHQAQHLIDMIAKPPQCAHKYEIPKQRLLQPFQPNLNHLYFRYGSYESVAKIVVVVDESVSYYLHQLGGSDADHGPVGGPSFVDGAVPAHPVDVDDTQEGGLVDGQLDGVADQRPTAGTRYGVDEPRVATPAPVDPVGGQRRRHHQQQRRRRRGQCAPHDGASSTDRFRWTPEKKSVPSRSILRRIFSCTAPLCSDHFLHSGHSMVAISRLDCTISSAVEMVRCKKIQRSSVRGA